MWLWFQNLPTNINQFYLFEENIIAFYLGFVTMFFMIEDVTMNCCIVYIKIIVLIKLTHGLILEAILSKNSAFIK